MSTYAASRDFPTYASCLLLLNYRPYREGVGIRKKGVQLAHVMIRIIPEAEIDHMLAAYSGAYCELWKYTVSHKKLAVRLSFPHQPVSLYFISSSCESMRGSFSWHQATLAYSTEERRPQQADFLSAVTDEAAGFKLVSSGGISFVLVSDDETDFLADF